MKLQFKRFMLLLIPILLAEALIARLTLNPKQAELSRLESQHNELNTKLASASDDIRNLTDKLSHLEQELSSPINEVKLELAGGVGVPTFLEYISRLVQSVGIKYISIQLNRQDKSSPQTSYSLKVTS